MDNIDNIIFEGYKCFRKRVELRNIKPINIIIGKNNIGKSSILDIIEMMYNPKLKWQNYQTNIYAEKVLSKEAIRKAFPETTSGGGIGNYYEFGKKYIGKTLDNVRQTKKKNVIQKLFDFFDKFFVLTNTFMDDDPIEYGQTDDESDDNLSMVAEDREEYKVEEDENK